MTMPTPFTVAWVQQFAEGRGQKVVIATTEDAAYQEVELRRTQGVTPTLKLGCVDEQGQTRIAILYYPAAA
jgi:hypothetical protein